MSSNCHNPGEFPELNDSVQLSWGRNADYWDKRMGEGNQFYNELVRPSHERLLALKPGEKVLDLACGNGQFARRMTEFGVMVTGVDISPEQIKNAKARSESYGRKIVFLVGDVTNESLVSELKGHRFDAISCAMGIMDIAEIKPLALSATRLLKADGRLVFSILHPAFNSTKGAIRVKELEEQENGTVSETLAIKIKNYIRPVAYKGVAMVGQPMPQYYFHRPISTLLNTFFDAGFLADRIEEPAFSSANSEGTLGWNEFTEIPPVLSVRLRVQLTDKF